MKVKISVLIIKVNNTPININGAKGIFLLSLAFLNKVIFPRFGMPSLTNPLNNLQSIIKKINET